MSSRFLLLALGAVISLSSIAAYADGLVCVSPSVLEFGALAGAVSDAALALSTSGVRTDSRARVLERLQEGGAFALDGGLYRLDAKTCLDSSDTKKSVDGARAIADSVRRVQTDLLSCLSDINPQAATHFLSTLYRLRPVIYCGGSTENQAYLRELETGSRDPSPASAGFDKNLRANAVATSKDRIILFTADPLVNASMRAGPAPLKVSHEKIQRLGSRDERIEAHIRNFQSYQPEPNMASLILHETMHRAGFVTGHTAHERTDQTDEVYQCTMLCSGPRAGLTVNSCLGCMGAHGHVITDEDRAFCARHYSAVTR